MRVEKGLTLITITHDMTEALRCDKLIIVHKGKVALEGTPEEIFLSEDLWKYGLKRPVKFNFAFEIAKLTGSKITKEDLKSNETLVASLVKMLTKPGLKEPGNVITDRKRPDENDIIMSVKGLSYTYGGGDTKAIDDINLDIRRGEVLGIVGES